MAQLQPESEDGLKEGAELIAERARARVPVLTGALRDSIHTEEIEDGHAVVADATDEKGYPYAIAVEFGGHEGGRGVGPHAFMIPAMEESRDDVIGHVAAKVEDV